MRYRRWLTPAPRSSARGAAVARPATAGFPAPERLEPRVLLADVPTAGHLDPTFGYAGTAAFEGFGSSTDAALQPDGRLLAVGRPSGDWNGGKVALARFNVDGSPDSSFGGDGTLLLDLPDKALPGPLAVQPDGRILVAGNYFIPSVFGDTVTDSFVARLLPDGTLDSTFGQGGVFSADLSGAARPDSITALALGPGGHVVGSYTASSGNAFGVLRLTPGGAPDPTFGGDGVVQPEWGNGRLSDVLVQSDGKLLLTGPVRPYDGRWPDWFFGRLNADGSPDATFGTDGTGAASGGVGGPGWPTIDAWSHRLAPAPGGGFYAAGILKGSVLVGRFLAGGARDATFDGDGLASIGLDYIVGGWTSVGGLLALPDGRVAVAGSSHLPGTNAPPNTTPYFQARFVARLNPDGSRDATFGDDGVADTRPADTTDTRYAELLRQADGKLIAAGDRFYATRFEDAPRPPASPVPVTGGPYHTTEAADVRVSAVGSYDLDGNILKYEWDTDYDGVTFTPDLLGITPRAFDALDGPSVRTLALRVTDDEGRTSIGTTPLTVTNTPPSVYFAAPRWATEGSVSVLNLFASDAGVDAVDHWTIDWGDGSPPQTVPGHLTSASHTYADGPATHDVRVTATDEDGTWPAAVLGPEVGFGPGIGPATMPAGTTYAPWVADIFAVIPLEGGKVLYAGRPDFATGAFEVYQVGADGLADSTFTAPGNSVYGRSEKLPNNGRVEAIARQADGKILAAGNTFPVLMAARAAVARYTTDGKLDPTFGAGGFVEMDADLSLESVGAVLPLPDGRVLVAGSQDGSFALLRLAHDGSLDATFGAGGRVVIPGAVGVAGNLAVLADGRIVAGGGSIAFSYDFVFARLNPDGSPDATFGSGGWAKVEVPGNPPATVSARRMVLAADGRIVAAGDVGARAVVLRLKSDGTLDPAFGDLGFAYPRPFPNGEAVAGLAQDGAGRLLLATSSTSFPNHLYALTRLTADGAPDGSFSATGTMTFDPMEGRDTATAMGLDAAGNVVVAGHSQTATGHTPTLVRLAPHGSHAVVNVAPVVSVSGPAGAYADAPYAVGLGYADAGADTPRSWQIDWGDGSTSDHDGAATSASHPYAAPGTYTITARVTDDDGTFAATRVARVTAPPAVGVDGTLAVFGTPDHDTISLGVEEGEVRVIVSGGLAAGGGWSRRWAFPLAAVGRVGVASAEGNDRLDPAGSFVASGLPLSFDGGTGTDTFVVRGTPGGDVAEARADGVRLNGGDLATLSNVDSVHVFGGAGADRVTVPAAPRIGVRFDGGDGDDTLEAAGDAGPIDFDGGAGADAITFRAAGTAGRTFFVGGISSGPVNSYSGVESLALHGTPGNDRFFVHGTSAGVAHFLYGEGGNDTMSMSSVTGGGGNLSELLGPVTFDGGAGSDVVDAGDGLTFGPVVDAVYELSDAAIARVGGARLGLAGVEDVRFQTWRNADTFRVTPSATTTFEIIADVQPGGPATDRLEIVLAGATGARQVPTSNSVGRYVFDNRRPVNYAAIDSFNDVVAPRPTSYTYSAAAGTYAVRFGEELAGSFTPADLSVRNAGTGEVTAATAVAYDPQTRTATFTVGRLPPGYYTVTFAPAGVTDTAGNTAVGTPPALTVAGVVGRYVFYHNAGGAAAASGDAAIAGDKVALLPGGVASAANVTSYVRGLNGVMIDLFGAADAAGRLLFETSDGAGGPWTPAWAKMTDRRAGAGVGGSDRISVVWDDGLIVNRWLRVTLPAGGGLAAADVFYFGNLVGDAGGAGTPVVNATDLARTRAAVGRTSAAALATFDFNRDGIISAADVTIVRNNQRRTLRLISVPAVAGAASAQAARSRPSARPSGRGVLGESEPDLLG